MEITDMNWRKSSHSGGNGGSCIEVASDAAVMVRDTTDRTGPVLQFNPDAWRVFANRVKSGMAARLGDRQAESRTPVGSVRGSLLFRPCPD
jgi:Domain of unknown function (DUF397)